jgi:glycosyltransferase involved in cell wall biosynthesis
MRFLLLLPTHAFPTDTGQRHRYGHLARYLARRHEVAMVYFTDQPERDRTAEYAGQFVETVRVTEHGAGGGLLQRVGAEPSEVFLYRSEPFRAAVDRLMKEFRPEVVISGEPALTQYVAAYTGPLRVLDYLCEATLQFERMRQLARGAEKYVWALRKAKYARFLRRIAPVYDLCLVNSREDFEALRAAAPEWRDIHLLTNGLDLTEYPAGLAEPEPGTLIYPGSVMYDPNRDAVEHMAREILPRIRAEVPGARLRVTGRTPEGIALARADGLEWTGYVPDVKPVIAGSWICAVPLRLGAGGARFKVLEALALGTALVSTAIGYEGVEVTDGVDVLMAEDAATFAACCVRVLREEGLRRALSAGGRRLMEQKYDWSVLGAQLLGLVEERVAGKGRAMLSGRLNSQNTG